MTDNAWVLVESTEARGLQPVLIVHGDEEDAYLAARDHEKQTWVLGDAPIEGLHEA